MADLRNLITDVAGLSVGHAHDDRVLSGVTTILFDEPAVAGVAVPGGAAGGRDIACLEPDAAVGGIDAIVLSGGSGFGLDAASGAQAWLREAGRGFPVGTMRVPIVPSAICFDLLNGGDKDWGRYPPYRELGFESCVAASAGAFELGSVGAGMGASTFDLKGGLGSASAVTSTGHTVGAVVVVNALGSALIGDGPHFWAGALEQNGEFGGLGFPGSIPAASSALQWKGGGRRPGTTIACVATDAVLDKAKAKRLAVAATAGLAKGLRLTFALMDGDTVFAAATGRRALADSDQSLIELGAIMADCLARAIARGVHAAGPPGPAWRGPPSWSERFRRSS
ncbi:MAG: P1 family peptidase [Hyphomicrobiaceae bacterium]